MFRRVVILGRMTLCLVDSRWAFHPTSPGLSHPVISPVATRYNPCVDYCFSCGVRAQGRCPRCGHFYCPNHGLQSGRAVDRHGFAYSVSSGLSPRCADCRQAEAERAARRASAVDVVELALFVGQAPTDWPAQDFWRVAAFWLSTHVPPDSHLVQFALDGHGSALPRPTQRRPVEGWRFEENVNGTASPRTVILCVEDGLFRDWDGSTYHKWLASGRRHLGLARFFAPQGFRSDGLFRALYED